MMEELNPCHPDRAKRLGRSFGCAQDDIQFVTLSISEGSQLEAVAG